MNKVGGIASTILLIAIILIAVASGVMWYYDYPESVLCNIITPSMGYRDLPLIYPTTSGVLGKIKLNFVFTGTIPKSGVCEPIEPFTPTIKIVGDILSGAPSYIHGLVCPKSAYNYSAFAHLITGPYTEKRAYTDQTNTILYKLTQRTSTARLFITENQSGDINIYVGNNQICIDGKIKTKPSHLMATISALINIPYPIWGNSPDWNLLSHYYSSEDLILMKIRYLELLSYRAEYLSLLNNNPTDYREYYLLPYLYLTEHLPEQSSSITTSNIEKLEKDISHMINTNESKMRRHRIISLLVLIAIFSLVIFSFPWESLTGFVSGIFLITIYPGIDSNYIWITTPLMIVITAIFTKLFLKRKVAIALGIMTTTLFLPTIFSITWLGVLPTLHEPSPFVAHLMKLTIPATSIVATFTLILMLINLLLTTKAQDNSQDQPSEP